MADARYNMQHSGREIDDAVDRALTGLDTEGKATDSSKLGGQLPAYYAAGADLTAEITRAKAAEQALDAAKLGKTEQAADSAKLGGQLPSYYVAAEALTAEVSRATAAEADKLSKTEQAADSAKLVGLTLADIMLKLYPVGAIYTSTVATDPGTLFGGTWERIQDTFLLAAGSSYGAGTTGGEAVHTLSEAEIPAVGIYDANNSARRFGFKDGIVQANTTANWNGGLTSSSSATSTAVTGGGGKAHNNMPPYLAVYIWKRIA